MPTIWRDPVTWIALGLGAIAAYLLIRFIGGEAWMACILLTRPEGWRLR